MVTISVRITLYIPFSHSLKEKRQVVRSIVDKAKNKFNISIAEVDELDTLQTAVIGIALVSNNYTVAQSTMGKLLIYIESNTEAELINYEYF